MSDQKPWELYQDQGASAATDDADQKPWEAFGGETKPESKGVIGHVRDLGLSALKSAIAVPETIVGLADIPAGGAVGKFLENEDGLIGFRPKQAKEILSDLHTDQYKAQQQEFQEADGILDKTGVALSNPSIIANTVTESIAPMLGGGVVARGILGATKLGQAGVIAAERGATAAQQAQAAGRAAAVAGALGEGTMMAGAQTEAIRQQTDDGLLTPGQSAAAVATGALGSVFGYAGGRLAQKLGIVDVDTMLARGITPDQVAANLASAPAKSIPRHVVEGAITEGFFEELPQSVSEQIIQNLSLDKPWHEGVDEAVVMGTLAGMAMGGPVSGFYAMTRPQRGATGQGQGGGTPAATPGAAPGVAPQGELDPAVRQANYNARVRAAELALQEQGEPDVPQTTPIDGAAILARRQAEERARIAAEQAASRAVESPDDEIYQSIGFVSRSQDMGLDPNAGPMSSAAALAVDSGASDHMAQQAMLQQAAEAAKNGKPAQREIDLPLSNAVGVDPETGEIIAADRAAELRQRLGYLQQQAKVNGWSKPAIAERDRVIAELEQLQPKPASVKEGIERARAKRSTQPTTSPSATAEPGTFDYDEERDGWAAEAWEARESPEARRAQAEAWEAWQAEKARNPGAFDYDEEREAGWAAWQEEESRNAKAGDSDAQPSNRLAGPSTTEPGIRRGPQSPTNQTPQESAKYDRWMRVIDSIEDGAVYTDPASGDTYTARVIEQGIDKRGKQRGKSVSLLDGRGVPAFDLASNGEAGKDAGYFGASIEGLNGPAWTFETKGNTERDGKAQPVGAQAAPAPTLPHRTGPSTTELGSRYTLESVLDDASQEDNGVALRGLQRLVDSGSVTPDEANAVVERAIRASKIARDKAIVGDYLTEFTTKRQGRPFNYASTIDEFDGEGIGDLDVDAARAEYNRRQWASIEKNKAERAKELEQQAGIKQEAGDIKAITAKQIPDMTDAEIAQAITHYGPGHKRTAKLQKEQAKRATTGATNVPQATETQQTSPQPPQAGRAPAADPAAAPAPAATESAAGVVDAGARWDSMTPAERQAVAEKAGVKSVFAKNLPNANWDRIGESMREGLVQAMAPAGGRSDGRTEVLGGEMVIVHGSGNASLSVEDIQIVRASGQKQGKKGRVYGGFYGTNEADATQAEGYAAMMGGTPTLYDVKIKPGTKVLNKSGDITRLSEKYINELVSQGYGLVTGTDPRGRTEHVVIDKNAIKEMVVRGESNPATTEKSSVVQAPKVEGKDIEALGATPSRAADTGVTGAWKKAMGDIADRLEAVGRPLQAATIRKQIEKPGDFPAGTLLEAARDTLAKFEARVIDNGATNPGEFIVSVGTTNLASFKLGKSGQPVGVKYFHEAKATRYEADKAIQKFMDERAAAPAPVAAAATGPSTSQAVNGFAAGRRADAPTVQEVEREQADEYAARLRKLGDEFQGSYRGRSLAPLARAMADHAIEQGRRLTDAEIAEMGKRFDVPADVVEQLTGNIFTFDAILGAAERRDPGAVALRKRQIQASANVEGRRADVPAAQGGEREQAAPAPAKGVAPGARFNTQADRDAADRLEKVIGHIAEGRNTPEGSARDAIRNVVEELRKPSTASSVQAMLEIAAQRLNKKYSAQADVVYAIAEQLGQTAAPAIDLKGKRPGDMLIATDGTLSRIEGIDDKTGRIRTTRNPNQLSERSVLIDQDTFDRLVRETDSVRMEAAKGQPTDAEDRMVGISEANRYLASRGLTEEQIDAITDERQGVRNTRSMGVDLELSQYSMSHLSEAASKALGESSTPIAPTGTTAPPGREQAAPKAETKAKDRPKYGESNKLVSQARREEIRELMRKKALNLNSGVDPELMALGAELAVFHIEAGTRKFADFAKAMIEDIGEKFTPFLRSFYDAARSYPGLDIEGMTPYEETIKQHAAMLTPEVREAAAEVVGTVAEKPKARTKKTGAKGDMVLTQDWGVEHIDGYGDSARETGNDTKDAFLKEARNYLNAVADALRAFGFEPHLDRKGKPEKPVSVSEGGPAGSGDVSLVMRNEDNGNNVYITIGGTSLRGVVPSTPSGIALMYRVGPGTDRYASKAGNTWAPVDLSANDLAALVARRVVQGKDKDVSSGQVSNGGKAQAGANGNPVSSGASSTLEGKNDAGRNAASDDQSLGTVPPSGFPEAGQGIVETSAGLRPSDEDGNGRFEEDRSGRGNSLGGSPEPVLSGAAAEAGATSLGQLNPKADAPNKLAGENPGNFRITEDFGLGEGTAGQKIEANLQAIRTLRKLQSENRYPTRDEQAIMARYVGWGGLKSVFDPKKADSNDMYGRAQRELRQLLDKDEYSDAFDSVRNAHYTAKGVVDAMWRLARHMGFNGGRALEPTVGVGNFIGLQPEDMANSTEWHASELDYTTGLLAKSLYPDANVLEGTGFQEARFAQGVFDLAIGNPPFGSQTISSKMKGYSHLNGMKVHNLIIAKTGMHLRPGGVMAMVVTHRFLDTANDEARRVLAKDFKFLGAIRLPNDAFRQNAGTDVVTDIVILQKYREGEARVKDPAWLDVNGSIEVEGKKIRVNKYFEKNHSHILGRSAMDGSLYAGRRDESGEGEYTVHGDGRDIGKAIDEIIATSMADLSGVLEKTDQDMDVEAAMLQSSDIPIGGLRLSESGIIERRDMDDAFGNAVIEVITPETMWKDEAREWEAVRDAVVELRDTAKRRRLTEADFAELVEQSRFAFKADGSQKADPSKAMAALYDLVNAAAKPEMFTWDHDQALAEIEASLSRRKLGEKGYEALRDMLDLRNRTLALIRAELSDAKTLVVMRGSLNAAYDKFVAKHGFLSDPKNFSLLGGDVGAEAGLEASFEPEISAAVSKSSGIPKRKASAKKADILSKRVNFPRKEITSADSAEDAMDISLSERGKVDLAFMASLLKKPVADVIAELSSGSNPRLFRNPETDTYEDAESYLCGNVRHKLEAAKAAGLKANIKALEAVQPKPKTKSQIKPSIRGLWMPETVFADFLSAMGVRSPEIMAIHQQGILKAFGTVGELTEFGSQFSHPDRSVIDLFNAAASGKSVTIMRSNGKESFKDEEATKAANAIVARMAKVFENFAYSDDSRAESIVAAFNERMNTHAPRTYDGEKYLRTVGANPSIQLRRTQKNGAWRMVLAKTMLGDHVVGAGKTYTAIAGVMERRRLGLSRKPMIAVPNHLVVQWARDFYKMYPGAKVLAATPADFSKKNRRRLMARIATGDYDAVIVGHTSIGFIENFEADHRAIIDENIEALETAMEQAREAGDSKRTLTQMRDRIAKYEDKLGALSERTTDEIGIDFKALGIDYLVVDEAHEFKNLEYATSGERVVGMNDPNGSKRAFDLYVKVRGLLSRDGGVTFLTGTPVSNSLVEIYTMMRYLAHDELLLRQQEHFDAWSGAYAATETKLEYTATQKLKPRRVLAGLNNLSALRQIYEHFADIITMRDLKRIYSEEKAEKNRLTGENERTDFPIPKVKGGKRRLDAGDITEAQSEYMDYLVARMKKIESMKGRAAKDYAKTDNALNVLTDARKMSLDIRVVDPTAPRDENGKVMRAAKAIKANYDKWNDVRGTQMIFCDLSTPAKTAAKDARNLIKETAEALFGEGQAKQVRRQLDGKTYQEQWAWLRDQADELIENENLSQDKRDSIEAYFAELEDADATILTADIGFSVYDDMRAVLVEMGIPESEIAFIHDYNTPEQKEKLFDRMNSGYIRVLMGSSAKMGAGTNAQKRLVALHHMDAPWRPSDVEQREGRIIRQGNLFYQAVDMQDMRDLPPDIISATPRLREEYPNGFEVKITAYSTNGTSDTVMWQVLERKAGGIEQFRNGGLDSVEEDSSDSDQYAEFMATSTGNPIFRYKLEAERDYTELEAEVSGVRTSKANADQFLRTLPRKLREAEEDIEAFDGKVAAAASYGGQSGTAAEYRAAMLAATAEYEVKYAEWLEKSEAAAKEIQHWEKQPESTRGAKPSTPTRPPRPSLTSKQVQANSGYARAVSAALAAVRPGAPVVTLDVGEGLTVELSARAGETITSYRAVLVSGPGPSRISLEGTTLGKDSKATDSPNLVRALEPDSIEQAIADMVRSRKEQISNLNKRKPAQEKLASVPLDESKVTAARELMEWYQIQVRFAEERADVARSKRPNRYIPRDSRRFSSWSSSDAKMEDPAPYEMEVDGEKYNATGYTAGNRIEAFRASDGLPVVIRALFDSSGKKDGFGVIEMPESLREEYARNIEALNRLADGLNKDERHNPLRNADGTYARMSPAFSRSGDRPARPSPKAVEQAISTVQATVDRIQKTWKNAPPTVITWDITDPAVPDEVREHHLNEKARAEAKGKKLGEPEGLYFRGKVYLFAAHIKTPQDTTRVLLHETFGHFGLRGMFGDSLIAILDLVIANFPQEIMAKRIEYNLPDTRQGMLQAADEVLAVMAQTNPQLTLVQRAVAAIRAWLRKHVPMLPVQRLTTNDIIHSYLIPARNFVVLGKGTKGAKGQGQDSGAARASRNKGQTQTPAFKAWFGNSKVVDAEGKPLVVYHGTNASFDSFDPERIGSATDEGLYGAGFYFAPKHGNGGKQWGTAGQYAADPDGGNIIPAYLSIQRPLVVDAGQWGRVDVDRSKYDGVIVKDQSGAITELVAFRPEQIKSATGNNGDFDGANPDIRFSRSGVRDLARRATAELNKTFTIPGKLHWWHKTVGTMYNLAERSPFFRPVFQSAQGFIDDVAHYAADAAELAPKLLPRLETWRDIAKTPISAEDNKAVARPIFEGTLMWTRDDDGKPVRVQSLADAAANLSTDEKADIILSQGKIQKGMLRAWKAMSPELYAKMIDSRYESQILKPGIVWTDAELRSIFELNDEQVGLYREFRAATNRSLDTMARADMLRFGGDDVKELRDAVMDAADVREAAMLLRDHLAKMADSWPDREAQLLKTADGMMERSDKVVELQAHGYAPLSRFGKYTVDVVENGERQYFGLFETKREANKMAEQMRAEFGQDSVTQGTLSDESFKLFAGITPESLELFGNMLGLDSTGDTAQDQAFQEYLRLTKTNRSAMRRLIHRKGVAGYSEDVGRVLASFVYSNARQTAAGLHMGDLGEAVNKIPKEQGELKDAAVRLSEYIKNPQEEAQAIRGLLFAQYLGGSVASAFVNMTQPFAVTFPWLSQHGGARKAAAELTRAAKQMSTRGHQYEADLAAALKDAEDDGVVSPQEVHQLMAQARGSGSLRAGDGTRVGEARAVASNAVARLSVAWGKLFGAAEQVNRRITFIAAYRVAKSQGMPAPAAFARRAVMETQFVYSKASKMQWGRGAIGGTLMTFKTYSVAYMELMSRLWTQGEPGSQERKEGRKAALLMLATLMLMGGAGGLPFAEDAEDLIDGLAQLAGYNFSTQKAKEEFLASVFGEEIGRFIDKGVSGLPGAPMDVSGRLGMGNLIPGTGLLQERTSHTRDVLEIAGPMGDFANRIVTGSHKILGGDVGSGLLEMSPIAVRNAAKGVDMAVTGMYRDTKGYKVLDTNVLEAALKSVGFQPESVARVQESNWLNQRGKAFYNMKAQEIRAMWAAGIFEKDGAKVQRARDAIADWNAKNPEQPMLIRIPDIMRRVREMSKTKDQRIADTAPKAMRAQMREDVARVRSTMED